jgi:alcohol dehydrogenase
MRQLVMVAPGQVRWEEMTEPDLDGPGDALVEPVALARCDLDAANLAGRTPMTGPHALGHEFAARVIAVGDEVTVAAPGDVVVVPFQVACGDCASCRAGWSGACTAVPPGSMYGFGALGGEQWGAAYSDVVRVPFANGMLVPVPTRVTAAQAANVSDNIVDAWRTVGPQLAAHPGASVLVIAGAAPSIGLWAAELAGVLGAGRVTYADSDPGRLELARGVGAQTVELDGPMPRRLDRHEITVDASGDPAGLACAIRSTTANHSCFSIGIYWTDPPIPFLDMYSRNLTVSTGRPHSRPAIPAVLQLMADGRFDPMRIAEVVDWEDVEAWRTSPRPKVVAVRANR